jgi:enoyl-CoA hydratase
VSQKLLNIEQIKGIHLLRLRSDDAMNRLSTACILELTSALEALAGHMRALIITGNQKFFSAGADLHEIAALNQSRALSFLKWDSA